MTFDIPASRSFHMGFSTWPPDFDVAVIEQTFELTNANSDLRLVHMEGGVPWVEMSKKLPMPTRIQDSWNYVKSKSAGKKMLIAISPLDADRAGLALYANQTGDNQPMPLGWENLLLNDSRVKAVFLAYAEAVIKFWSPDYLAIGIEVNILANKSLYRWQQYLELHKYVYAALKRKYPAVKVAASIQLEHFKGLVNEAKGKTAMQKTEVAKLLKFCDFAPLSVYPYFSYGAILTPDYFNGIKALGKQLAISETGWPSKDFQIGGFTISGSESAQVSFMQTLLKTADSFAFVVNWVSGDYSRLLAKMPPNPILPAWVYDGLWDDNLIEKPALAVWRNYLALRP